MNLNLPIFSSAVNSCRNCLIKSAQGADVAIFGDFHENQCYDYFDGKIMYGILFCLFIFRVSQKGGTEEEEIPEAAKPIF
jgi:hypothetical protein